MCCPRLCRSKREASPSPVPAAQEAMRASYSILRFDSPRARQVNGEPAEGGLSPLLSPEDPIFAGRWPSRRDANSRRHSHIPTLAPFLTFSDGSEYPPLDELLNMLPRPRREGSGRHSRVVTEETESSSSLDFRRPSPPSLRPSPPSLPASRFRQLSTVYSGEPTELSEESPHHSRRSSLFSLPFRQANRRSSRSSESSHQPEWQPPGPIWYEAVQKEGPLLLGGPIPGAQPLIVGKGKGPAKESSEDSNWSKLNRFDLEALEYYPRREVSEGGTSTGATKKWAHLGEKQLYYQEKLRAQVEKFGLLGN